MKWIRRGSSIKKFVLFLTSFYLTMAFFLLLPSHGLAQEEILGWFGSNLGKMKPTVTYQITAYGEEEVPEQGKEFKMAEHRFFSLLPFHQSSQHDGSVSVGLRSQQIRTDAALPDTREAFPDALWDLRLGAQYRNRFQNGWIGGASVALGSASDQPFASIDETLLHINLFARVPQEERNAWLFYLNYSKTREFLNNIPIPGMGYFYEPSDRARFVVGIPFFFMDLKPAEKVTLSLAYFIVRSVRARITYSPIRPIRFYGSFVWRNESYFRADREEDKDRLFYYEKQIFAGIQWDFLRRVFLDVSAGWSFDRFYFEGEKYSERDQNRVNITDGPFLGLRLGARF